MDGGHCGCETGGVKVGGYSGYQEWGIMDDWVPGVPGMERYGRRGLGTRHGDWRP